MGKVRTGKKPEDPGRGTPAYMLTFGDMMNLMLCFFIALFNPTQGVSEAKIDSTISAFRQGLGVFPASISVLRPDQVLLVPEEKGTKNFWGKEQQLEELEKRLRKQAKEMQMMGPGYMKWVKGKAEIKITIGSQALFDSGSAEVRGDSLGDLDKLADFISKHNLQVIVEGHTDDRPISTAVFPSNWELSVGRASRVARYLIDKHGIKQNMISASGYADTKPIATNASNEGRQKNRRIEIILKPTQGTPATIIEEAKARNLFGDMPSEPQQ